MNSISVIIPSKNRFTCVKNLLDDLDKQLLRSSETIVIDQSDIKYPPLQCHLIVDDISGPCRARNLGLARATGDIIVFLDDDIRINADFLLNLCTPIIEGKVHAVVGAMCDPHGNYPFSKNPVWTKNKSNWLLALTANPGFAGQSPTLSFTTCCAAISREVYEKVGGFDPFFDPNGAGEDRDYGLRIFHAGYPILYEGKAFVRHLGAPTGGRRQNSTGFKYQNILEANSVYICAKYFSWPVFDQYCSNWLFSILQRGLTPNPRIWGRQIKWWHESRNFVKKIREIKRKNNW